MNDTPVIEGIVQKAAARKLFRKAIILANIIYAAAVIFLLFNIPLGTEYGVFLMRIEIAYTIALFFCMISAFSAMPKSDESRSLNLDITSPALARSAIEDDSAGNMDAYFIDGPKARYVLATMILSIVALVYSIATLPCFYTEFEGIANNTVHIITAIIGVLGAATVGWCSVLCVRYATISNSGEKCAIKL